MKQHVRESHAQPIHPDALPANLHTSKQMNKITGVNIGHDSVLRACKYVDQARVGMCLGRDLQPYFSLLPFVIYLNPDQNMGQSMDKPRILDLQPARFQVKLAMEICLKYACVLRHGSDNH